MDENELGSEEEKGAELREWTQPKLKSLTREQAKAKLEKAGKPFPFE